MLQSFPQPDDPRKAVDHPEALAGGSTDEETAIIRAEIQCCERSACGTWKAWVLTP
jgi:hypothetical protein